MTPPHLSPPAPRWCARCAAVRGRRVSMVAPANLPANVYPLRCPECACHLSLDVWPFIHTTPDGWLNPVTWISDDDFCPWLPLAEAALLSWPFLGEIAEWGGVSEAVVRSAAAWFKASPPPLSVSRVLAWPPVLEQRELLQCQREAAAKRRAPLPADDLKGINITDGRKSEDYVAWLRSDDDDV